MFFMWKHLNEIVYNTPWSYIEKLRQGITNIVITSLITFKENKNELLILRCGRLSSTANNFFDQVVPC